MNPKIINHQSIELNWLKPTQVIAPKTLVLGSFNPFGPANKVKLVDYYYGRDTNHCWPSIAFNTIPNKNGKYYYKNLIAKKMIMNNHFCCLDVIDSIKVECDDVAILNDFIDNKIYSGFSDQILFTTNTIYKNHLIIITRTYNQSILNFLQNTTTIKRVIHTMGENRINQNGIYPTEYRLREKGFKEFIINIIKICNQKNIDFIIESYSPSDYAVKNGSTDIDILRKWLKDNLFL